MFISLLTTEAIGRTNVREFFGFFLALAFGYLTLAFRKYQLLSIVVILLLAINSGCAIIFKCKEGSCDSDDIKVTGNEIAIRLQDFDDHIEFVDSELAIISRFVVSMPENINTLLMVGVRLGELQPMALKQFYNLHTLNLADNALTTIDEKTFSGLGNLRWLFLAHNRLNLISAAAFAPLSELEYLNISHNAIEDLDKRTFSNLKKLEAIYLDHNQLCALPRGLFERNRALKFVDVSANQIKALHLTFHDALFMFNGAANQLVTFRLDFKIADRENDVAILRLEDNRLRNLTNITNLRVSFELNLANNQIVYHQVGSLGALDLFNVGLRQLWSLNLSDTGFHFAHHYNLGHDNPFAQMTELKELDISYNGLREVDFKSLRIMELRSLHLTGNNLTELDVRNLKKLLPNLRGIEISDNNWNCTYLSGLVKQMEKIPNLEVAVRPHLKKKGSPNVDGIGCFNGTANEVLLDHLDHDTRIQMLESRIEELYARLTEALQIQHNFSQVLKNLTNNYEYQVVL